MTISAEYMCILHIYVHIHSFIHTYIHTHIHTQLFQVSTGDSWADGIARGLNDDFYGIDARVAVFFVSYYVFMVRLPFHTYTHTYVHIHIGIMHTYCVFMVRLPFHTYIHTCIHAYIYISESCKVGYLFRYLLHFHGKTPLSYIYTYTHTCIHENCRICLRRVRFRIPIMATIHACMHT